LIEEEPGCVHKATIFNGWSPLHYAAINGHLGCVSYLISQGATIDSPDTDTETTPLHLACGNGHLPIASLLLEHGANPTIEDHFHATPLSLASEAGHEEVVQHLLQYHDVMATIDRKAGSSMMTPLALASHYGKEGVVRELLKRGADPLVVTGDDDKKGRTPIMIARIASFMVVWKCWR